MTFISNTRNRGKCVRVLKQDDSGSPIHHQPVAGKTSDMPWKTWEVGVSIEPFSKQPHEENVLEQAEGRGDSMVPKNPKLTPEGEEQIPGKPECQAQKDIRPYQTLNELQDQTVENLRAEEGGTGHVVLNLFFKKKKKKKTKNVFCRFNTPRDHHPHSIFKPAFPSFSFSLHTGRDTRE